MSREEIETIEVRNRVEQATGIPVFIVYKPKVKRYFSGLHLLSRKEWVVKLRSGKEMVAITTQEDTELFRKEGSFLLPFPREVA